MKGQAPSEPHAAGCPHLGPVLCSLAVAALLLGGVQAYVSRQLPARLPYYAAHAMSFKVNGNVLQRLAFCTPNELPIYGSSELDRWADNRADAFFRDRPTGFAVFPVGRGGATCLMIQQKLAAVGPAARGKKAVIFLSPSWFLQSGVSADAAGANLSAAQLSAWIFGDSLGSGLQSEIARRLQDFPGTLQDDLLLTNALGCLSGPTPWHRLGFALLFPLGKLQNAVQERFDYGVILWEIVFPQRRWQQSPDQKRPSMDRGHIDWEQLAVQADADMQARDGPPPVASPATPGAGDAGFLAQLSGAREFADLGLLVRVLQELRMQALFIIQPFNGGDSDAAGITPRARRVYYERVEKLLGTAGFSWADFSGHEEDRRFFEANDHPSAKAWIFYDREINRFYTSQRD